MADPRIGGRSVNDILLDLSIQHGISLERLKSSEVKKLLDLLARADREILDKITARLGRLSNVEKGRFIAGSYTTQRLQDLRQSLDQLASNSYDIMIKQSRDGLDGVSRASAAFEAEALQKSINPVLRGTLDVATISNSQARAIVRTRPIAGRLLKKTVQDWSQKKKDLVETQIRLGLLEGEAVDAIARRIRSSVALGSANKSAETIIRTAVSEISNAAREDVWQANKSIIKKVRWVSTLDNDTCVICGGRDGQVYDLGDGPRPPAHLNCRCVTVAVTSASNLPGERASAFGPVPKDITFEEFLRGKDDAFQDDVLGKTRAELFRTGDINLKSFTDKTGNVFTLEDLRLRQEDAFRKAGL